jgi:hypothetical protein
MATDLEIFKKREELYNLRKNQPVPNNFYDIVLDCMALARQDERERLMGTTAFQNRAEFNSKLFEKGKQAGRDEQLLEDSRKTLPEFWETVASQRNRIAELEAEKETLLKAKCADMINEPSPRTFVTFEIGEATRFLSDYDANQKRIAELEAEKKELRIQIVRYLISEGDCYTGEISHIDAEKAIVRILGLPKDSSGWLDQNEAKKVLRYE